MKISDNELMLRTKKKKESINLFFYFPIILLISILPLIVRAKYINPSKNIALYWHEPIVTIDYMSFNRALFLIIFTLITIISLILLCSQKKIVLKKDLKYYIPIYIYVALITFSLLSSTNKEISLKGFFESYEGYFILLCYVSLLIVIMNFISSKRELYIIKYSLIFLIVAEGAICIGEFFGYQFLNSSFAQFFMFWGELIPGVFFLDNQPGTMRGTLFNSNYVGSFAAIILPLSISFFMLEKNKYKKSCLYIIVVIAIATWLGCNSRAGHVGMFAISFIVLFFLRKKIIPNLNSVLLLFGTTISIALILNHFSDGRTLGQFIRLDLSAEIDRIQNTEADLFKDIVLDKDSFSIVTKNETLDVEKTGDSLLFRDGDGNVLQTNFDDKDTYTFKDNRYKEYSVSHITALSFDIGETNYEKSLDNFGSIIIDTYDRVISFTFTEDQAYVLGYGDHLSKPIVAPTFSLLSGYERFASGRGYIWSRSIMLLPDAGFFGYGPDTYPTLFPQDDFVAKMNAGIDASLFISKPHNMYLQIAINTGIPSLIALLVLWAIYVLRGLKLYYKMEYDSMEKYFGFACMMAVIGYLVAGIFNDSKVEVAPLFWIILGVGISINELLIKAQKEGISYEEAITLSGGVSIVRAEDAIACDINADIDGSIEDVVFDDVDSHGDVADGIDTENNQDTIS